MCFVPPLCNLYAALFATGNLYADSFASLMFSASTCTCISFASLLLVCGLYYLHILFLLVSGNNNYLLNTYFVVPPSLSSINSIFH